LAYWTLFKSKRLLNGKRQVFCFFFVFNLLKGDLKRTKPPGLRLDYSGTLSLLVDALHHMSFDPVVKKAMEENKPWAEFENTLYSKYLEETECDDVGH